MNTLKNLDTFKKSSTVIRKSDSKLYYRLDSTLPQLKLKELCINNKLYANSFLEYLMLNYYLFNIQNISVNINFYHIDQ